LPRKLAKRGLKTTKPFRKQPEEFANACPCGFPTLAVSALRSIPSYQHLVNLLFPSVSQRAACGILLHTLPKKNRKGLRKDEASAEEPEEFANTCPCGVSDIGHLRCGWQMRCRISTEDLTICTVESAGMNEFYHPEQPVELKKKSNWRRNKGGKRGRPRKEPEGVQGERFFLNS
jgi:hypothetical protein